MSIDHARAVAPLFDAKQLKLAREAAGLRKVDLAQSVGVTPAALTQYEHSDAKPSAATLAKLAIALGQRIDFFATDGASGPNDLNANAFFRSLRSTRQLDRDRAQAHAILFSRIVKVVRGKVRLPALNLPGEELSATERCDREAIELRAEALRSFWKLESGPVPNMVRLLESNGIVVVYSNVVCSSVDSFSRWFDDWPLIVLDSGRKKHLDRLRFDAAHELGHLVMHRSPEPGNGVLESQAHMFAAAFLMPRRDIASQLPTRLMWPVYRALKKMWGVSVQALLRRAFDLGRITLATYRRGMIKLTQLNQRKDENTMFPLPGTEPAVLLPLALKVLKEKRCYTIDDLANDVRMHTEAVYRIVFDNDPPDLSSHHDA